MWHNESPESGASYPGRGRVLRVKEGYNPNSSSLGSVVFSLHPGFLAVPVLLAGAAAWIADHFVAKSRGEEAKSPEENTEEEEQG